MQNGERKRGWKCDNSETQYTPQLNLLHVLMQPCIKTFLCNFGFAWLYFLTDLPWEVLFLVRETNPWGYSGFSRMPPVGTQKCRIFIHLSLHYSLHFIAQLNLHHIIFINTFGFHIIIFHFIHFSIKSEFMIKY